MQAASSLLVACSAGPSALTSHPVSSRAVPTSAVSSLAPTGGQPDAAARASASRPTPTLEKSYTGQGAPTIEVRNAYPQAQHLFVDWRLLGTVASGASSTFELEPGVHTVTSADSADPNHNPSSLTEMFESGYAYGYRIVAK